MAQELFEAHIVKLDNCKLKFPDLTKQVASSNQQVARSKYQGVRGKKLGASSK